MSRTWAVIKREFGESVRTKTFLFGTIFGPVLILALFLIPALLARSGGGERDIGILDATEERLGQRLALALVVPQLGTGSDKWATRYRAQVVSAHGRDPGRLREDLRRRIAADALDGFVFLPTGTTRGATVLYEGKNATNFGEMAEIEGAIQRVVQEARLDAAGVDAAKVRAAMRRVTIELRKVGKKAAAGTPVAAVLLAYLMGIMVYTVVILYGNSILRGVLEEKKDRIVEIMVSSIRPGQLLVGKVVGIGGVSLLQVLVWTVFGAFSLAYGDEVIGALGGRLPELPRVPATVAVVFVFFFTGGFFLYSVLYAVLGAMTTTDQEAQHLQFVFLSPLIIGVLLMTAAITNPEGGPAVVGSLVPFTSPLIMPVRATLTEVPWAELAAAVALLILTGLLLLWAGAKIYRIGILATGKRPRLAEVWRWLRTA